MVMMMVVMVNHNNSLLFVLVQGSNYEDAELQQQE